MLVWWTPCIWSQGCGADPEQRGSEAEAVHFPRKVSGALTHLVACLSFLSGRTRLSWLALWGARVEWLLHLLALPGPMPGICGGRAPPHLVSRWSRAPWSPRLPVSSRLTLGKTGGVTHARRGVHQGCSHQRPHPGPASPKPGPPSDQHLLSPDPPAPSAIHNPAQKPPGMLQPCSL